MSDTPFYKLSDFARRTLIEFGQQRKVPKHKLKAYADGSADGEAIPQLIAHVEAALTSVHNTNAQFDTEEIKELQAQVDSLKDQLVAVQKDNQDLRDSLGRAYNVADQVSDTLTEATGFIEGKLFINKKKVLTHLNSAIGNLRNFIKV